MMKHFPTNNLLLLGPLFVICTDFAVTKFSQSGGPKKLARSGGYQSLSPSSSTSSNSPIFTSSYNPRAYRSSWVQDWENPRDD
ncbi:hypothetical protein PVL30_000505 [Lodderomyces elongisporus]|uniref:uncharacterized protein n=1 Tax=Lodderomyces elongisporus TaxID=36914 RepID=UPI002926230B|nr:uncharacterized protein PVL30_000505 [Lodderomyces elongisporus]WLF76801.1 hypothetical protein PVL30_000505 [Lodderomyces elongisporus]